MSTSTAWNYLKVNLVITKYCEQAQNTCWLLIMQEPLIMQGTAELTRPSCTSKVFNTVITLDTYQFLLQFFKDFFSRLFKYMLSFRFFDFWTTPNYCKFSTNSEGQRTHKIWIFLVGMGWRNYSKKLRNKTRPFKELKNQFLQDSQFSKGTIHKMR